MARRFWAFVAAALIALTVAPACAAAQSGPFSDWAAVVVAGDDHAAHTDALTETFDNARRDVASAMEGVGFSPANLVQFSVRPQRYPDARPQGTDAQAIFSALRRLTTRAGGGCLIYFTSHGAPQGIVIGDDLAPPGVLAAMIDQTCGARPTVIVLSACYSGVFIPRLKKPTRLILTAARADRASFGCGESDRYPFFDACLLGALPAAGDFLELGPAVQTCVARRERAQGVGPPSRPQFVVGAAVRPVLAAARFARALAPAARSP
jgi:hypothetical protein